MAETIGISPESVDAFVKAEGIELPPRKFVFAEPARKKHGSRNRNCAYTSMKNYNQNWLRHIQSKIIHPEFLPCDHDGPCREDTCSCIRNGFFCTKHCGYGNKSPNFFRGCECKAGQCRLYSCPCYAANRECDPDLCRSCGACSDPPDAPAGDGQRCRNDNISMGRRAHTLVAESTIKEAGWGLFNKHELKKGDFVIEYVGERISQEEAERRGVVYDKLNMRWGLSRYALEVVVLYSVLTTVSLSAICSTLIPTRWLTLLGKGTKLGSSIIGETVVSKMKRDYWCRNVTHLFCLQFHPKHRTESGTCKWGYADRLFCKTWHWRTERGKP